MRVNILKKPSQQIKLIKLLFTKTDLNY